MNKPLNLLLVEDSEDDALLVTRRLKKAGYDLTTKRVDNRVDMKEAIENDDWDLVLCDHSMPNFDPTSALSLIADSGLDLPLIMVSGAIDENTAVEFMKIGARSYVLKDNLTRLVPVIERELRSKTIRQQKREADLALASQLQFLQQILEAIPAAIFYKNKDGVYQGCNSTYEQFMGVRREFIINHTLDEFIAFGLSKIHEEADRSVLESNMNLHYEDKITLSDGSHTEVMIHKAPYTDVKGQVAGVVGVIIDITSLKMAEQKTRDLETQLRQAQKLEAIGTLAGGIAHDFNNILSAIVGYSELTRQNIKGQKKPEEYLGHVLSASQRAKDLVKQILTFSRRTEQKIQPVNVTLVAKEAFKLLRGSLPPSIDMAINIESESLMVESDPTNIHQIIINLCTNAAHAMADSNGILKLELKEVEKGKQDGRESGGIEPGRYVQIKIEDTGHGMSPATLERIFDPYFTTKPVGEGTGLGLSVVHGIVVGMGGSIEVHSEMSKGTMFTILLPRIEDQNQDQEAIIDLDVKGTEKIMVVDDEIPITKLISRQLTKLGYQVTAFNTGDEAWKSFKSDPDKYDAVITDYLMPGMNGKELVGNIKKIKSRVPIIIHTGFDQCFIDMKQDNNAPDAVCFKPATEGELAKVLRELFKKKQ